MNAVFIILFLICLGLFISSNVSINEKIRNIERKQSKINILLKKLEEDLDERNFKNN